MPVAPHPLAVLARRLLVEDQWDRKVLLALDVLRADRQVHRSSCCWPIISADPECARRRSIRWSSRRSVARRSACCSTCAPDAAAYASHGQARRSYPGWSDLHVRREGGRSDSGRALQALTTYRNRLKHGAEGVWDEETFRADFEGDPEERLPNGERRLGLKHHLAAILEAVGFLRDFPLVYAHLDDLRARRLRVRLRALHRRLLVVRSRRLRLPRAAGEPAPLRPVQQRRARACSLDPFLRRRSARPVPVPAIFMLFSAMPDRERPPPRRRRGATRGRVARSGWST